MDHSGAPTLCVPGIRELREVAGLLEGLAFEEVADRIASLRRDHDESRRGLAFYLADLDLRRGYQALGYANVVQFAKGRFGMGKSLVHELLRVGKALRDLERIDEAFLDGRLNWSKVEALSRVVTAETEDVWLDRALKLSTADLETEVRRANKGLPPGKDSLGLPGLTYEIRVRVSALEHEAIMNAKRKLSDELGEVIDSAKAIAHLSMLHLGRIADGSIPGWKEVDLSLYQISVSDCPSCETAHLLTEESEILLDSVTRETIYCNASLNHLDEEGHVAKDKKTSGTLRRKVLARDGNRCVCCGSRTLLHAHHAEFRGKGGRTNAGNLTSVCIRCHDLIHEGLLLVLGNEKTGYIFTDKQGKRLDEEEQPVGARLREIRLAAARLKAEAAKALGSSEAGTGALPRRATPPTTIESLPPVIDPETFAKHAHLFAWNERRGMLEFTEGVPVESPAVVAAPESTATDAETLRPERLEDVIGQVEAVRSLEVAALAAKKEDRPAPHCLLEGPAGTGKTSIARASAREMGTAAKVVYGPFIKDALGLITLLLNAARGVVYFIDEVHDLPKRVAEALYEAMEDHVISLMVYSGSVARTIRFKLNALTIVGATTEPASLPGPFRDRFPIKETLHHYEQVDLVRIIERAAARMKWAIDRDAACLLAKVSNGVPREALGHLLRCRDHAVVADESRITKATAETMLAARGIDELGLTREHRKVLRVLLRKGGRRPVSEERLAILTEIEPTTLRKTIEPTLIRLGLLCVTAHGRVATERAKEALGRSDGDQEDGFPVTRVENAVGGGACEVG